MTEDTVTVDRLSSLVAMLDSAAYSIALLERDARDGTLGPAEAAAIVNETIANLVAEAR